MLLISLSIIPFTITYKYVLTRKKLALIIIWELFILTIMFSKVINHEFVLLESFLYMVVVPLVFFSKGILDYKNTIIVAAVLSVTPFFLIFQPWNRLAILITLIAITLIGFINFKKTFVKYSYLTTLFILIIFTTHRTSLLTFLVIVVGTLIVKMFINKIHSFFDLLKRLVVIGSFIGVASLLYSKLYNAFLYKREITGEVDVNSISAGRVEMWLETLRSGITFFGNGEEYFTNTFNLYHAHNIIFQVIGAYGIISLLSFLILIYFLSREIYINRSKPEYIYFFSAYFLIGFTEYILFINTFFIYPSILFFVLLGSLFNEDSPQQNKLNVN